MKLPWIMGLAGLLAIAFPQAAGAVDYRVNKFPPVPTEPGIFGVGFTNVTDTSARLVFTSNAPLKATVTIAANGQEKKLEGVAFEEIHNVDIPDLKKGQEYRISISGVTKEGKAVASDGHVLVPVLRPASRREWPGYTIIGTTVENLSEYELAAQAGARMARIEAPWYDIFPDSPEMDKKYFDKWLKKVGDLKKAGLEPLVVLDYCVPWARPYTDTTMTWRHPSFGPPDKLEDWEYYVRAIVSALKDSGVHYYEIWNEPDAGYLSTGRYVERPGLPAPVGREPFKDNWPYWLGDRYAPMIGRVRKVMDELQPDAVLLNGGWNRDYTGQRGDLLFERGMAPYFDIYTFHTYCGDPMSFAKWYDSIDGGFRKNIDRIFRKHDVTMPLAITEWGWPAWAEPKPEKGFVSLTDAQMFLLKSTFYFLSMERVEILVQFHFGAGPDTRDKDPLFFMLVNRDPSGKLVFQPAYGTFRWLAGTFGSKTYRALKTTTEPDVKAYAIQLKDSNTVYLAAWQDGVPNEKGVIAAAPAREITVKIEGLDDGSLTALDADGRNVGEARAFTGGIKIPLPEISADMESTVFLARIDKNPKL